MGKGIKFFSNIGVAEFLVEAAEMKVGDKLLITGPTTELCSSPWMKPVWI